MLLQPITLLFSTGTLKPSVYTLMTSEGRGHEYVTIATQKRQSVGYCNHKIPWV